MLMRLMSKGEYLIVPKGTKFTGSGKLGLKEYNLWKSILYIRSYNQSVALKHAIMGQQVNKTLQNSRILRKQICIDVPSYYFTVSVNFFPTLCLHTHYWLHAFLPVSSAFFQVFSSFFRKKPISSGNFWTLVKIETKLYFFKYSGRNVSWRVHCSGSKLGATVKGYVNFWLEGDSPSKKPAWWYTVT